MQPSPLVFSFRASCTGSTKSKIHKYGWMLVFQTYSDSEKVYEAISLQRYIIMARHWYYSGSKIDKVYTTKMHKSCVDVGITNLYFSI